MVFVSIRCHCETSPQTGRGNPPVEWNQVTITTKNHGELHLFWCFSVHFPTNRGIATPVCALARNDSNYSTNKNFPGCCDTIFRKKDGRLLLEPAVKYAIGSLMIPDYTMAAVMMAIL